MSLLTPSYGDANKGASLLKSEVAYQCKDAAKKYRISDVL